MVNESDRDAFYYLKCLFDFYPDRELLLSLSRTIVYGFFQLDPWSN